MATKKNPILVPDHVYVPKHEIMNKKDAQKVLNKLIEVNKSEKGHIDNSGYTRNDSWKFWKKLGTGKREEFNPNPIVVEYFFGLFPTEDLI